MPFEYAYANARIKGMKSHLLSEATIREMLEVGSLDEIVEILEESPAYRNAFVSCAAKNRSGTELVSAALHENLDETLHKMLGFLPRKGRRDFGIIVGELDVIDLKTVIAKKLLGQDISGTELVCLNEENRSFLKHVAEAGSVEEALEELRNAASPYGEMIPEEAIARYEKTRDYRVFVDAINDFHYKRLAALAEREKDAAVAAIIRARLNYLNTSIVLRAKKNGLSEEETRKNLIPFRTARVQNLLRAGSLNECITLLEKELRQKLPFDETLVTTEIFLERKFIEKAVREFRLSTLGFAVALGYYYAKVTEIENIRKIALATEYGIKKELKEKEMVFAVNV